jgi:hypothetical protein
MIMSATAGSRFTRGSYLAAMALTATLVAGCSTPATHPILYPNSKYNTVGEAEAQTDVEQCMQMASNHGVKTTADSKVLERTATSAAVGGASAGAWGAVTGDFEEHLLAGAAAGAAGGAVSGILNSNKANPVYKNFTQKCLRDQGYDVVGWN